MNATASPEALQVLVVITALRVRQLLPQQLEIARECLDRREGWHLTTLQCRQRHFSMTPSRYDK